MHDLWLWPPNVSRWPPNLRMTDEGFYHPVCTTLLLLIQVYCLKYDGCSRPGKRWIRLRVTCFSSLHSLTPHRLIKSWQVSLLNVLRSSVAWSPPCSPGQAPSDSCLVSCHSVTPLLYENPLVPHLGALTYARTAWFHHGLVSVHKTSLYVLLPSKCTCSAELKWLSDIRVPTPYNYNSLKTLQLLMYLFPLTG